MGVTGLWTVLQPCARPIKLETLNKKRLAVDASIWIYQFLKAVRDKEGNALRNSHIVGFFRRICKLLYFGIKPVFVFDGGAPALKRQTIAARKRRREGRREDAVRTAGKLLALQVQRRTEEEQERRRRERMDRTRDEEETIPEDVVYVEELQMTPQERRRNRQFKKKDQYHLPDLEVSPEDMGAPDDLRIMSHEELEVYARQFHSGDDINFYDFSKIDFTSPFFLSLPTSDQYNILNAARLRSRLRMGYSKDQLDSMFPDRMAFSRFQIDRVKERNELTQRLMNLNSSNGEDGALVMDSGARVAGEKGREYVLVKNDAVEGGWALGVVSGNSEGDRSRPIDVERLQPTSEAGNPVEESDDEDGGFEDVPIEGLNRLPKTGPGSRPRNNETERWESVPIQSNKKSMGRTERSLSEVGDGNTESLFLDDNATGPSTGFDRQVREPLLDDPYALDEHEEQDLRRAIAMSMEHEEYNNIRLDQSEGGKRYLENLGAGNTGYEGNTSSSGHKLTATDGASAGYESDDDMDLQAALAHSISAAPRFQDDQSSGLQTNKGGEMLYRPSTAAANGPNVDEFDGPLPFEKLNINHLGAPSQGPTSQTEGGGFEIASEKPVEWKLLPLPPWFTHDVLADGTTQNTVNQRFASNVDVAEGEQDYHPSPLRKQNSAEVIELDSSDEEGAANNVQVVVAAEQTQSEEKFNSTRATSSISSPISQSRQLFSTAMSRSDSDAYHENADESQTKSKVEERPTDIITETITTVTTTTEGAVVLGADELRPSRSPSPVFEDATETITFCEMSEERTGNHISRPSSPTSLKEAETVARFAEDDSDQYSDPEDDQLLQHLALEAEEHARFASSLNNRSKGQNQEDYERELRTLRSQQKKDRRDADEISNIMITECQQLLTLFGIPYITASMEAEAQCAELVRLGLVDGIVTDDSDCFLFGGTRVYKNMFSQAKYVECYLASDLEREFDLDRNKLIRFAHLLGSDYTEGIPGIGPVTALEILSEFNSDTGLEDFKQWWQGVQAGVQSPTDKTSPFRKKFVLDHDIQRRNATRISLPPAFPSVPVTQAYLHPEVDSSRDPFQWGVPDLDALRAFLMSTIGWSKERTDEVLVPVIRDINRREHEGTQSNLTAFFSGTTGAGAFAPRRRGVLPATSGAAERPIQAASRRMEGALGKLKEGAKRKRGSVGLDEPVRDRDIDSGDLEEGGKEREVAISNETSSSRRGRRTRTSTRTSSMGRSRPSKRKASES